MTHRFIRMSAWKTIVLAAMLIGCGGEESADGGAGSPEAAGSADAANPGAARPGEPAGLSPRAERIEFTTSDDFRIVADLHRPGTPDPAPLIVAGHQLYRDRTSWDPLVPELVRAGYAVAVVDHRGFGESTADAASVADLDEADRSNLYRDLTELLALLAPRPDVDSTRIVTMGAGISVDPAVRCARLDDDVRAVVLLPGYVAQSGRDFLLESPDLPLLMIAASAEVRGRDLVRQYAERFTGPLQEFVEIEPTEVDDATWEGTDGLARDSGVVQLILWFLERHVPARASGGSG